MRNSETCLKTAITIALDKKGNNETIKYDSPYGMVKLKLFENVRIGIVSEPIEAFITLGRLDLAEV